MQMTITELSQQDPITHVHIAEIGSVGFVLFCLYTVSTRRPSGFPQTVLCQRIVSTLDTNMLPDQMFILPVLIVLGK